MSDYFVHESSLIDNDVKVGKGSKIWHFCHILPQTVMGQKCSIGQNCVIGPKVSMGNNVKVQNNVSLYEGVVIEDDVFIGPSAVFTNVINPRSHVSRKHEFKKTYIKKGASIGANATVVCGISIGQYAFIGAGSVVTKDVPDFAVVYGNPAKFKGWVSVCGHKLQFNSEGLAKGPSNDWYRLDNNVVKLLTNVEVDALPKETHEIL